MERPHTTVDAVHATVTSQELFPYITSFLRGTPRWATMFELKYDPVGSLSILSPSPSAGTPGLLPRLAIQHTDMATLKRLYDLYLQPQFRRESKYWFTRATHDAAACGNLEALQWLFKHTDSKYLTFDVSMAVDKGHADVVQFLIQHPLFERQPTMDRIFDLAAAHGHLKVVQVLHAANWEGTSDAMDQAAAHGHLDVVEFLHELRFDCTTAAADGAAANGHRTVVQWLLANRSEGVSEAAMYGALVNRQLDTARYLWLDSDVRSGKGYGDLHEAGAKKAIPGVFATGDIDFVASVHELLPDAFPRYAMAAAAANGHLEIVQFLHSTGRMREDVDLALLTASKKHPKIVEFLLANESFSPEMLSKATTASSLHTKLDWFPERPTANELAQKDSENLTIQIGLQQKLAELSITQAQDGDKPNCFLPANAKELTASSRHKTVKKPRSLRPRPTQIIGRHVKAEVTASVLS